jgi:hypothetical protein
MKVHKKCTLGVNNSRKHKHVIFLQKIRRSDDFVDAAFWQKAGL